MEQTNLVVTPDGKTWDEVTRDVGYLGSNVKIQTVTDTGTGWETSVKFDEWRGTPSQLSAWFNKDFAIAYDRVICLKEGMYRAEFHSYTSGTASTTSIKINGIIVARTYIADSDDFGQNYWVGTLKRGDYVQVAGEFGNGGLNYERFTITKE